MARRLEAAGDTAGALAALMRAAAADKRRPRSGRRSPPSSLRQNRRDEAEKAAREALVLDRRKPRGPPRARSRSMPAMPTLLPRSGRARSPPLSRVKPSRISSAWRSSPSADIALHYTLGRLYLRTGAPDKAVQALGRVLAQNPELRPGPVGAGAGACGGRQPRVGHRHARRDRRGRAARRLGARAVSGTGGPVEGSGRELHARAGRHADEPRAEIPPRRGAVLRRRLRALCRVRRGGAGRASGRPALPAACRRGRSSTAVHPRGRLRCSRRR